MERTTRAVLAALRDLLPDVPYRDLTVQHILDRAGVSRATFYKHYRGKDDAFRASLAGMLALLQRHHTRGGRDGRLYPVRELVDHITAATALRASLEGSERMERVWDDLRDELGLRLESQLAAGPGSVPEAPALAARVLAGALVELVRWTVETRPALPTATLDERYQRMAATTIAAFGCVRRP